MGKRDKRVAFVNPIAAARARGPAASSGPTIKDYLGRNRMSLEEAEELIIKSQYKSGSDSLASWEVELNNNYKKELKKERERRLAEAAGPSAKKKKKKEKKKTKKQKRARSRSRSPSLSDSEDSEDERRRKRRKGKRRRKHKRRHHSSSVSDSDSDLSDSDADRSHRHKRKLGRSRDPDTTSRDNDSAELCTGPLDSNTATAASGTGGRGEGMVQKSLLETPAAGTVGGGEVGRKVLLPTPGVAMEAEGEEGQTGEEGAMRKKATATTKWTDKWDRERSTT